MLPMFQWEKFLIILELEFFTLGFTRFSYHSVVHLNLTMTRFFVAGNGIGR